MQATRKTHWIRRIKCLANYFKIRTDFIPTPSRVYTASVYKCVFILNVCDVTAWLVYTQRIYTYLCVRVNVRFLHYRCLSLFWGYTMRYFIAYKKVISWSWIETVYLHEKEVRKTCRTHCRFTRKCPIGMLCIFWSERELGCGVRAIKEMDNLIITCKL